jgi:hypothetical protein
MVSWLNALREYNKDKSRWCIPKKGSSGYTQVKKIMSGESKAKSVKLPQIDVGAAMEANQKRRGKLFGNFENKMRMLDLAKKMRSNRDN